MLNPPPFLALGSTYVFRDWMTLPSQNEIYDGQSKGANVGVDGRDWTFPFWDEGHVL